MDISVIDGEELSSVTFWQEHLQLDFSGPVLTIFHWPEVFLPEGLAMSEGSYAYREPGYRDALCMQIGESIETTSFEFGVALEMQFENGTIIRCSLREEELDGRDAGTFSADGDAASAEEF